MSGKLALFLLQLTTKKSFWATLVAILLTIIGFIGFLMFVLFGTALAGTYTAEDDVILAVDAQYSSMEKALYDGALDLEFVFLFHWYADAPIS